MITHSSPARSPSILVVEDEGLLRMMAVDIFEDAGFRVIQAETGDEGARLLAGGQSIDGLLTDIEMPGRMNGLDLAKMTRDLRPSAAILVVSGRIAPEAGDLPQGCRFISKPYDATALLSAMTDLMRDTAPRARR